MKNIKFLIEKACIDYCEQVDSVYNEKDVFQAGASFALSLFKWRKVSEGLPEKIEKQQVLVTNDIEDTIWVDVLPIHLDSHIDYIKQNYKYWMPIPQID